MDAPPLRLLLGSDAASIVERNDLAKLEAEPLAWSRHLVRCLGLSVFSAWRPAPLRQKRRLGRAEMLGDGADAVRVFAPLGGKLGGIDRGLQTVTRRQEAC